MERIRRCQELIPEIGAGRIPTGISESTLEGVQTGVSEECRRGFQQIITDYEYDSQGNLLKDGTASYSYDSFNRLVKAETFSGESQVNRYDAEGLRHEMEENGKLVQFLYRGRDVVAETTDDGSIIRYIRGNRLISSDNEKARCYYHYASDEMGSITHIIKDAVKRKLAEECSTSDMDGAAQDETGQDGSKACIVNRYEYDAFGNTVSCDETVPNRFRFAGKQYDQITQQYYLRARFYNPVIGRFLQEDDYYGDGLNLYAYCRNNPVSYVDPSGHGTESAPDKWAENNRKDIQDLVDEINHGNGASPSDIDAIKSLAKEFGLDPGEFDIKSSKEVNQQALKDLVAGVNQAGGASPSEKKILKEFAEEYGMDYDSLGVKETGGGTGKGEPKNPDYIKLSEELGTKIKSDGYKIIDIEDAAKANSDWKDMGYNLPPVAENTKVYNVEAGDFDYARVFKEGVNNPKSPFIMRADDIKGLSATEIAEKYALPQVPDSVVYPHIPTDTPLEVSIVGPQESWGTIGGDAQYAIKDVFLEDAWFTDIHPLD